MESKLPVKYENNFFSKFKKFFINIFNKNSSVIESNEVIKEVTPQVVTKENEFSKMKMASNKVKLKEDILTMIEKNPQLLETLSIDKLKELDRMYDEIIEKNDRKIKQLKREIYC